MSIKIFGKTEDEIADKAREKFPSFDVKVAHSSDVQMNILNITPKEFTGKRVYNPVVFKYQFVWIMTEEVHDVDGKPESITDWIMAVEIPTLPAEKVDN